MHLIFSPEAHDAAATHLRECVGYTLRVVPVSGEPYDARLDTVEPDGATGQWAAHVTAWDDDTDAPSLTDHRVVDIYDDATSFEVL